MTHPALGSSLFALGFADHRGVKKNLSGRFFRNKGESIMTRMTIFAVALALGTVVTLFFFIMPGPLVRAAAAAAASLFPG